MSTEVPSRMRLGSVLPLRGRLGAPFHKTFFPNAETELGGIIAEFVTYAVGGAGGQSAASKTKGAENWRGQ